MSHPAARIVGGVVAGVLAAMATIAAAEWLGGLIVPLHPLPAPGTVTPTEHGAAAVPFGARLLLIAGWALGSFVGGAVAAAIVRRRWAVWPIALLVIAGVAGDSAGFAHPGWMIASGLVLPLLAAWGATRFARHG